MAEGGDWRVKEERKKRKMMTNGLSQREEMGEGRNRRERKKRRERALFTFSC